MGFLKRWFSGKGGPEAPSREEFAAILIDELRRRGRTGETEYDAEQFRLVVRGDQACFLNLHNAYREYCAAPPEARAAVLERYTATPESAIPEDFRSAAPHLRINVRHRSHYGILDLQLRVDGIDPPRRRSLPVGDHLAASIAFDAPQTIAEITLDQLERWGIDWDLALEKARANLWQISEQSWNELAPGLFASPFGDHYDAARLCLPGLVDRLRVSGDPVAVCPTRTLTLVTGSSDVDNLQRALAIIQRAMREERPVSAVPLRWDGDEWRTWRPDEEHASLAGFGELRAYEELDDYEAQKPLLQRLVGEDVFVASYSAAQNRDTGEIITYAVWTDGVPTLLPRASSIAFVRVDDSDQGHALGRASWATVSEHVGARLEATEHFPPRYWARDFPSDDELRAMGVDPTAA